MSAETFNRMEISNNRIKNYKDAGLIKKTILPDRCGTKTKEFYILTDKRGKDFCKNECNVKNFISNGHADYHNSKVAEYISKNLSKQEMETCLSERELSGFIQDRLDEFYSNDYIKYSALKDALENHTISMPDIVYIRQDGVIQAIEITTNNYKETDIKLKEQTAKLLNIQIKIIHTREV